VVIEDSPPVGRVVAYELVSVPFRDRLDVHLEAMAVPADRDGEPEDSRQSRVAVAMTRPPKTRPRSAMPWFRGEDRTPMLAATGDQMEEEGGTPFDG